MLRRKEMSIFSLLLCCVMLSACNEQVQNVTSEPPMTQETQMQTESTEETFDFSSWNVRHSNYAFVQAPEDYFEDAIFIGDSRTVGMQAYGDIPEATYYAKNGMTMYDIFTDGELSSRLHEVLENGNFTKVYVMLGINELGGDLETNRDNFSAMLEQIRALCPNAIFFIQANLRVAAARSNTDPVYNNARLNTYNSMLSELADGENTFYIDVNILFDDGYGNLAAEHTTDNTHLNPDSYPTWTAWLRANAIVKE